MPLDATRSRVPDTPRARRATRQRAPGRFGRRDQPPVLVALDDDGLAAAVIATGAALAERLDAPLKVVHSPYPDIYLSGEPYRLAIERGNEFVDHATFGYHVDERVIEADDPAALIRNVAREGAALIVLGTRGRTGLRAAILGSISQAVIAEATCPVVTVSKLAADRLEAAEREQLVAA